MSFEMDGFVAATVEEFKASLVKSNARGLVLDIDDTLSATNFAWFTRLEKMFGNQEGGSIESLVKKYHLAQNVPFWQTDEAFAWMQSQRGSPHAQDGLPLVPGAVDGVRDLVSVTPVMGYITVRPTSVEANTIRWLRENGFPDHPVISKPVDVPFQEGNAWKAGAMHTLWPEVIGIVDDNPKLPTLAGESYPGWIFLFSHSECKPGYAHAIACATWPEVVTAVKVHCSTNTKEFLGTNFIKG
jgi:hypothetical protein